MIPNREFLLAWLKGYNFHCVRSLERESEFFKTSELNDLSREELWNLYRKITGIENTQPYVSRGSKL